MILTIVTGYVSKDNHASNGFVHMRVKKYIEMGLHAEVFVLGGRKKRVSYVYEGVPVTCGSIDDLIWFCGENKVSTLCLHFLTLRMVKLLRLYRGWDKALIFVHGNEALMWHQRLFPGRVTCFIDLLKMVKYILLNLYSMQVFRHYFKNTPDAKKISIVCVSEWMKDVTAVNWRLDRMQIHVAVIPNIIDETTFRYREKTPDLRTKILVIRSFENGKYAPDMVRDIILGLSQMEGIRDRIGVLVIGQGKLFEKYTAPLKEIPFVEVRKGFMSQSEVSKIHEDYGIFLCPTRQDAQGCSMCEAMMDGLVPITTHSTAIPEFLPAGCELDCVDVSGMLEKTKQLINDADAFLALSKECHDFISGKCGYAQTIRMEMQLMDAEPGGAALSYHQVKETSEERGTGAVL